MQVFKPFQKLFPAKNTEGNTRTDNSSLISESYEINTAALAPDPTPATINNGGGVGSQCLEPKVIVREEKAGVRVFLMDRDREILRVCYEQQFLLKEHIETFFRGCSQRRINFRIQQLIAGGFIRRESYPDLRCQTLFRLTKTGCRLARQYNARAAGYLARLSPSTLFHDALVTSCRLRIADFWDAEFLPERALKELEVPEVPDGVWRFKSGKMIALEVECSDKGRRRFLSRLQSFGHIDAITFVLYVTPNERMHGIVKSYIKDGPQEQPVGVVLWDLLKSDQSPVWTQRGEVDVFSKREW